MPVLDAAHGITATVLGIDLRESAGRLRPLIAETGVRYPILLDRDSAVGRAYGVLALPTTCILAPTGRSAGWSSGRLPPSPWPRVLAWSADNPRTIWR